MRHLDLFSGIGGFALAADWTWPGIEHVFCEIDPFCTKILQKHWEGSQIYGDIRSLTADAESQRVRGLSVERQPLQENSHTLIGGEERPYLLTGGFPCQPFSQAGRRRGTEDDRYLWPEMLRVIREFHPRWVVGENVGGFVTWNNGMVLEQVQSDLEDEGYTVQAFVIPAAGISAPHRRDRVWIVGNSCRAGGRISDRRMEGDIFPQGQRQEGADAPDRPDTNAANAAGDTVARRHKRSRQVEFRRSDWGQNWLAAATRLCRVDDGVPRRMDRAPRLKALGNAIVPQVAAQIMRAIKEVDVWELSLFLSKKPMCS